MLKIRTTVDLICKKFCLNNKVNVFSSDIEQFCKQSLDAQAVFILNKPKDHIFFLSKILNLG